MAQSTLYAITRSTGTSVNNGFVSTAITGPLNTSQYPGTIPYHSYGTLTGQRPTPPQFFPSQEPLNSDMNVNMRRMYVLATSISKQRAQAEAAAGKLSRTAPYTAYTSQRQYPISTHMNYIEPIPASMYVNIKKSVAVGKSAYKVGLPTDAPISTKSYYPSGTRTALRRARSGGSCAPAKKGSIYNTSLRTVSGPWGTVPKQLY